MSFDLRNFSLSETLRCGLDLRKQALNAASMEQAAQSITQYLYDELGDVLLEERACALVRCYKTHTYNELPPELQGFARHALGRKPRAPTVKCLTLLGTSGDRPEWNDRRRSLSHQAVPLESVEMVEQAPMIAQLIKAFDLDLADVIAPTPEILRRSEGKSSRVFYVPSAQGSEYIPAQAEFVVREGIESVVGFGGLLRKGDLVAVILFSRVPISEETAGRFRTLALDLRAGLFNAGDLPTFRADAAAR